MLPQREAMRRPGEHMHDIETIEDLRPAPYNPRSITDEASTGLRASMQRFGDISGIVWNRRSGTLVCGHQRVKQLRELGAELTEDRDALVLPNGDRFPVRVVDIDLGEEMTANVTANNEHIGGAFTAGASDVLERAREVIGEHAYNELQLPSLEAQLAKIAKRDDYQPNDDDSEPKLDDKLTYSVVVDFDNENDQAALLNELEVRGMKCRLLMS